MVQDWCIGIELVQLTRVPACQCCANFGQCITNPLSIENKNSIDREKPIENYWLPILTKWRSMQCQSGWNKKSLWSSLWATNGVPIGFQWTANWVPVDWHCQLTPNGMSIYIQSYVLWLSIGCQLTAYQITIEIQFDAIWGPILCQLTSNWIPIYWQSDDNFNPIRCQSTSDGITIDCQSDANRHPIRCQSKSNWMPIEIQLNANWDPILTWLPIE